MVNIDEYADQEANYCIANKVQNMIAWFFWLRCSYLCICPPAEQFRLHCVQIVHIHNYITADTTGWDAIRTVN